MQPERPFTMIKQLAIIPDKIKTFDLMASKLSPFSACVT